MTTPSEERGTMTDPTTDPQTTEPPEAVPDPDETTAESGNAEAAKYRRKLREAETERDTARQTVDASQRVLVEHLAGIARVRPAALWASGVTLDQLRDDTGNIDPAKVTEAAEAAARNLGLSRTPRPDPSQGGRATVAASPWETAFTRRR